MKNNLDSKEILNKKFNQKINGYNPKEVDDFLDKVIEDYDNFEDHIKNQDVKITKLLIEAKANKIILESNIIKITQLETQNRILQKKISKK